MAMKERQRRARPRIRGSRSRLWEREVRRERVERVGWWRGVGRYSIGGGGWWGGVGGCGLVVVVCVFEMLGVDVGGFARLGFVGGGGKG